MKHKQFDFLRKKKEAKEENSPGYNTFGCFGQQSKTVNGAKRPEFMWPLSISPMEQQQQKFSRSGTHDHTHS